MVMQKNFSKVVIVARAKIPLRRDNMPLRPLMGLVAFARVGHRFCRAN